jgi:uncharacterized protein (TIGR01777 family)
MGALRSKIVLPGGAGFLGQVLAEWFTSAGHDVVVLTRRPQAYSGCGRAVAWDGRQLADWWHELDGALAVVNLAGRSVNCRYHARNRDLMMRSRVEPTRVLGEAIARCATPPRVWLNSSTATIYKHSFDRPMDEATGVIGGTPEVKDEFSIEVATAWEKVFDEAVTPRTRKVALRTAMVFSNTPGTVYRVLRRLVRLGLGGPMAGGGQYVSWIHERDFCRAVEWLIEHEDFTGPVNLAAPRPLTNRAMMHVIRQACHVRFGLPATRTMLEMGAFFLRTETELIIKSRRVVPGRLSDAGFTFEFNTLAEAVGELEGRKHRIAGRVYSHASRRAGDVKIRLPQTTP